VKTISHQYHIKIRRGYAPDADAIARIINESWESAYAGIVPQEYLDSLADLSRAHRLVDGLERFTDLRYYIFEENGVPVGAASLHPSRDEDMTRTAEFSFFYFLPQVWRHGYGRLLLNQLKRESLKAGYTRLCCWVLEENQRAISFYESQCMLRDGARQTVTIAEVPLETVRCVTNL
jgi:GNAT superfamily N-acetyltransferase